MTQLQMRQWIYILIITIGFTSTLQAKDYPFTSDKWKISNLKENVEQQKQIVEIEGKQALLLSKNNIASLHIEQKNFSIEFDVKDGSMPGCAFRVNNLFEYEYMYLRLMNNGKNGAIQYFPVYNGSHAWAVYNYPTYEASATFSEKDWIHVTMHVWEDNLKVFIGNTSKPNLEVTLMHSDLTSGSFAFFASFADSYFANVQINKIDAPFKVSPQTISNRYINKWEISEQFESSLISQKDFYLNIEKLANNKESWQNIKADPDGLVNLAKYYNFPRNTVFARTTIISEKEKEIDLLFDYTFSVMIALNRAILFCGTELDSHNFMRVIDGEEKQTLTLHKGENELIFMIRADDCWQEAVENDPYLGRRQSMNWGFIARLSNYDGISLK